MLTSDFTLKKYELLCQSILAAGYSIWTVSRYKENDAQPDHLVIFRHDIDRRPQNALKMALLEHELGIHSTFYIRMVQSVFQPDIVRKIASLGHEIGYHYETLAKARGNQAKAIELFESELSLLREFTPVKSICKHGSPLSPYDNGQLWRRYDYQTFGISSEAFHLLECNHCRYLTDTGRAWDSALNLRDHLKKPPKDSRIKTTDELIAAIRRRQFDRLCIQTHPERWPDNSLDWITSIVSDLSANQVKSALKFLKKTGSLHAWQF